MFNTEIKTDTISSEWHRVATQIDTHFVSISNAMKKENFSAEVLGNAIEMIQSYAEQANKINQTIEKQINAHGKMVCYLPEKKFRAVVCAGFSVVTNVIGIAGISFDYLKDDVEEEEKSLIWTGLAFIIVGVCASKLNDYLWNSWGNEEAEHRKLLELKNNSDLVIRNTNVILNILIKFNRQMERALSQSEKQLTLRKTKNKLHKQCDVAAGSFD